MKMTKIELRKEIRMSTRYIRKNLQAIEKNIMNKYAGSDYIDEKSEKIAYETKKIQKLGKILSDY